MLPREIRDRIFICALADTKANSFTSTGHMNGRPNKWTKTTWTTPRREIANALLSTCRRIYLETWNLPLKLNPYIELHQITGSPTFSIGGSALFPWQLALIQRLDLDVEQENLERYKGRFFKQGVWCAKVFHRNAFIFPWVYQAGNGATTRLNADGQLLANAYKKFSFASPEVELAEAGSQEAITFEGLLEAGGLRQSQLSDHQGSPPVTAARVLRSQPITHLTIRLAYNAWTTYRSHPESVYRGEKLYLDPVLDGSKPRTGQFMIDSMLELAAQRQAGNHPEIGDEHGWAFVVGSYNPDLKYFELVLETKRDKEDQLDLVVDCAKTWRFPIAQSRNTLVWDGRVECHSWSKTFKKEERYIEGAHIGHFEVRIVRYIRKSVG